MVNPLLPARLFAGGDVRVIMLPQPG